MAYATGTASDIEDLVDKFMIFAVAEGWTQREKDLTADKATISRGTVYATFRWDNTTKTDLAVYQSLGWVTATDPHNQTDDSGQGDTSVPIDSGRRCNFKASGPFTAYHFFLTDSAPFVAYCVVEVSSGIFRHAFQIGSLDKRNNWSGGEFVAAGFWDPLATIIDVPTGAFHSLLIDGLCGNLDKCATIHAEGLPDQGVNEKWLVAFSGTAGGTDRAGEIRRECSGMARSGGWPEKLCWMPVSQVNAYKALAPVEVYYRDAGTTPDTWFKLGTMPAVAIVNMKSLSPGDSLVIGSDTYVVFPWVRKQKLDAGTEESWNAGIAYLKLV